MKFVMDADILISYVTEAFSSLNTAAVSLPVYEFDMSEIEAMLQALAQSLQDSVAIIKDIKPCRSKSSVIALPTCLEGHPLVQILLIMTIHFRADRRENNSCLYKTSNYSTKNRTLWI